MRSLGRWISHDLRRSIQLARNLGLLIKQKVQLLVLSVFTNDHPSVYKDNIEGWYSESDFSDEEDTSKTTQNDPDANDGLLPESDCIYHAVLQATHDDDALDQAAAAFSSICENIETRRQLCSRSQTATLRVLANLEIQSLIHLLSPEASYRCNLTASETVQRLNHLSIPGLGE